MPFTIADVFSDRPLAGNQLAVFTDAAAIPERLLQPLAREMNFSETVFVYAPVAGGDARIRIFTPHGELPFAGHPVLGTAVVLATERGPGTIGLETGRGLVPVEMSAPVGGAMFGRMSQPIPTIARFDREPELLAALGLPASSLPVELYDNGVPHCYVTLGSPDEVAALDPDMAALTRLALALDAPAIGFNCAAGDGRRWKTRMFSPADGIPEDPATGSAAGPLACHLVRHGVLEPGEEITISQGAEIGRPSELLARADARLSPDGTIRIERVEVGGFAVVVARGSFDLAVAEVGPSGSARATGAGSQPG